MKRVIPILMVAIAMVATSCAPSLKITGNWMNKDVVGTGKFHKVLLFTISSSLSARQTVEDAQESAFAAQGITIIKSYDVLTPNYLATKPSKEDMIAKIKATGCDAIFTSALLDVQSETRYVPGAAYYSPYPSYGYYGSFGGYYGHIDPYVYEPGYYTEDQTYYIESNLYDVETEEIVWSVQSEAYNPGELKGLSKQYAALLVEKLRSEGVLKKK